jgi:putative tricarboxylic transport membrane protein
MLSNLLIGLKTTFSLIPMIVILAGSLIGLIFGAIPGLGPTVAATLLISFTYTMDPMLSILLIASVYVSATFGGSQTAILYNIPGSAENTCTAIDGYKLTKQGKASEALGTAIYASAIGGILSCVALIFFTPYLSKISYLFGSFEYFAFGLFGLAAVISLQNSTLKGIISAIVGILIGCVGLSAIDGSKILTFNLSGLYGGFNFIPVMLGTYAVAEVFHQAHENLKHKRIEEVKRKIKTPSIKIVAKIKGVVLRSSIVGILIGILPAVGAVLANYIGYTIEEKVQSRSKNKKIGEGDIRGVAAPEAANNAAAVATFIPMLALGIPGGAVTAILIGVFEIHGLKPGPMLFVNNSELVYTLFVGLLFVNILIISLGYFEIKAIKKLLLVPKGYIFPIMLVFAVIGSFVVGNNMTDVYIMLVFGLIGFFMKKNGFSIPILVLGIVLSGILESNFARMVLSDYTAKDYFTSYIGLTFIVLSLIFLLIPIYNGLKKLYKKH